MIQGALFTADLMTMRNDDDVHCCCRHTPLCQRQVRERMSDGSIQTGTGAPHRPGMVDRHTTAAAGPSAAGGRAAGKKQQPSDGARARQAAEKADREGLVAGIVASQAAAGSEGSGPGGFAFKLGQRAAAASAAPTGWYGGDAAGRTVLFDSPLALPLTNPVSIFSAEGNGDGEERGGDQDDEDDDELSCPNAAKVRSWQAAVGVVDDRDGALTRLLPYDLDPDRLWEVLTALNLVDKVSGLKGASGLRSADPSLSFSPCRCTSATRWLTRTPSLASGRGCARPPL